MSQTTSTRDVDAYLGTWAEKAALIVQALEACIERPVNLDFLRNDFIEAMRQRGLDLLNLVQRNIPMPNGRRRQALHSQYDLALYLMALDAFPDSAAASFAALTDTIQTYVKCLNSLDSLEKINALPRAELDATLSFFRAVQRLGARARRNS